mmetsp:Transcript_145888/g.406349  ORF Transcript_145888/g.406349 Transcript_145888/m.406349 type:complete len:446 (-) Transcript_145888:159-1496(-)
MGLNSSTPTDSAAEWEANRYCCLSRKDTDSTGETPLMVSPCDGAQHPTGDQESEAGKPQQVLKLATISSPACKALADEGWLEARPSEVSTAPTENEPEAEATPDAPEGALLEHPSVGSAQHFEGGCKRCCFFPKGRCVNGAACEFCHYPHENRKRSKRKGKKRRDNTAAQGEGDQEFILKSSSGSAESSDTDSGLDEIGKSAGAGAGAVAGTSAFGAVEGFAPVPVSGGVEPGAGRNRPERTNSGAPQQPRQMQADRLPARASNAHKEGATRRVDAAPPDACQGRKHRRAFVRGCAEPDHAGKVGAGMPMYVEGCPPAAVRDKQQPAFIRSELSSKRMAHGTFSPQGGTMYGSLESMRPWETRNGREPEALRWSATKASMTAGRVQQLRADVHGFHSAIACNSGLGHTLLRPGAEPIVEVGRVPLASFSTEQYGGFVGQLPSLPR